MGFAVYTLCSIRRCQSNLEKDLTSRQLGASLARMRFFACPEVAGLLNNGVSKERRWLLDGFIAKVKGISALNDVGLWRGR